MPEVDNFAGAKVTASVDIDLVEELPCYCWVQVVTVLYDAFKLVGRHKPIAIGIVVLKKRVFFDRFSIQYLDVVLHVFYRTESYEPNEVRQLHLIQFVVLVLIGDVEEAGRRNVGSRVRTMTCYTCMSPSGPCRLHDVPSPLLPRG